MSTPDIVPILAALRERLLTISTAAGYNNTVTGVDLSYRNPPSIGAGELPRLALVFDPVAHDFKPEASNYLRVTAYVDLVGAAAAPPLATNANRVAADFEAATARILAAARLEDDVLGALGVDVTLGRRVVQVVPVYGQHTSSHVSEVDHGGARVTIGLRLRLTFDRRMALTEPGVVGVEAMAYGQWDAPLGSSWEAPAVDGVFAPFVLPFGALRSPSSLITAPIAGQLVYVGSTQRILRLRGVVSLEAQATPRRFVVELRRNGSGVSPYGSQEVGAQSEQFATEALIQVSFGDILTMEMAALTPGLAPGTVIGVPAFTLTATEVS